ncbi:MAG TPA: hypothetical protein VE178_12815 [Silvibacterium sp.]|nr:hypothetical protein [Silvibacterium sp.]
MKQQPKKTPGQSPRSGLYLTSKSGGASKRGAPKSGVRRGELKDDGTRQLLQSGGWTVVAGLVALVLMTTVFGGITRQGPHTSSGWLALIVALMCLPFGSLLFLLGAAKWLRNRRMERQR